MTRKAPEQKIRLTDELLLSCGAEAAEKSSGVSRLAPKGIRVSKDKRGNVILDISVIVNYGCRIPETAWEIQENVKRSAKLFAGVELSKINVNIQGVE